MSSDKKTRSLARSAGLISAATMLSRLLGLIRESLFAALLGAGHLSDAFLVAFRIPNLLRDLFAEGALAQAFIPTFKKDLQSNGQESAYELGNRVAGTLLVVIGFIVAIAILLAPQVVDLLTTKLTHPEQFGLTVTLTRIMMPFLILISLSSVAMGMLNAQNKFAAPALAPAMFNIASIGVGTGIYLSAIEGKWAVIGWSMGTVLGGLLQLGVQLPPLWRSGFRPRLRFDLALRDPRLKRIATLMLPAIVGLAAVQVNIIVNTYFASSENGAITWLNNAFRFLQLPIGVFGVAIATVSTTRYAESAAANDTTAMGAHLSDGLRLVAFLTVPSMVGLIVLGSPIISLIYQHGRFGASDTHATAAALQFYAIGLVAYAGVKVLAPAFYAMNMARIAVIASLSAVAGNLAINIGLHGSYGYRALAFGTAAAAILNFSVLYFSFHRKVCAIAHGKLLGHLLRVLLAGAIMGAIVWLSHRGLVQLFGDDQLQSTVHRLVLVFVPVIGGAISYALVCAVLGVPEVRQYWNRVAKRF